MWLCHKTWNIRILLRLIRIQRVIKNELSVWYCPAVTLAPCVYWFRFTKNVINNQLQHSIGVLLMGQK